MVFNPIKANEIAQGKTFTGLLKQKIKDNFDDLNSRAQGGVIEQVSSNNTILARSQEITQFADTSGGGFTTTLPLASLMTAKRVHFKKVSTDSNSWVIAGSGSDTIEGQLTYTITTGSEAVTIQSNGENWYIISDIAPLGAVNVSRMIATVAPLTGGGNLTANRTISIPQATSIQDGYLAATDWIDFDSKQEGTLTNNYMFVGNASNVATGVALSGDVVNTIGNFQIAAGSIVNADVNASAAISYGKLSLGLSLVDADFAGSIDRSKIGTGTSGNVVINNGSGGLTSEAQLSLTRGGTGQSTALAAFDALSPVTTRGDLVVRGASNNIRLGVGTSNTALTSDGTDPSWNLLTNSNFDSSAAIAVNKLAALGGSAIVATDGSGFLETVVGPATTELGYLTGVTSNIQDQIDTKGTGSEFDVIGTTGPWLSNPSTNTALVNLREDLGGGVYDQAATAYYVMIYYRTRTTGSVIFNRGFSEGFVTGTPGSSSFTYVVTNSANSGGTAPTFDATAIAGFSGNYVRLRFSLATVASFQDITFKYRILSLQPS